MSAAKKRGRPKTPPGQAAIPRSYRWDRESYAQLVDLQGWLGMATEVAVLRHLIRTAHRAQKGKG